MTMAVAGSRQYGAIVYMICLTGALGGLLFGLDMGFVNNALATIRDVYGLDVQQSENFVAFLAWGGIAGAFCSGFLSRWLGRKKALVLSGFLFSSMALISTFIPPMGVLQAARFGLGFAVGIASFTVPLYLAETAPTAIRGGMATLFQLMITIGIFAVAAINVTILHFMDPSAEATLSAMFVVILVFALLMFLLAFFLPESPRWLMMKGRENKARQVLQRIRVDQQEIDEEVVEIKEALHAVGGIGFEMLSKGFFWKILVVGVLMQMFQQLVGINMMINYSATIFGYAGMTGLLGMLLVPTVNMLFTFPAIRWIEKWGRKKLLYLGGTVMFLSMMVAGTAFYSFADGGQPSMLAQVMLVIAVITYIFGFACSWGPVVWVMCAEIFPLKGREIGVTVTTMINWNFAGLVAMFSLTGMEYIGKFGMFYVFGGMCVLAILFVRFFVPETRGVSLEHIEHNLEHGVALRNLGGPLKEPHATVQAQAPIHPQA